MEIENAEGVDPVIYHVSYRGEVCCPGCQSVRLRKKEPYERRVRHVGIGLRKAWMILKGYKYRCDACHKYFRQRFPGLLPYQRSTEPFREQVCQDHWDGISQSRVAQRAGIGPATVERWFVRFVQRKLAERKNDPLPRVLGIDEHFFSRRDGYATTLCDLQKHRVHDVVLGRSEAALDNYFRPLAGKERVRVVCMDLSSSYRALVRKHFPHALIVADRFHVVRLVGHHMHVLWRRLDPHNSRHRGLVSLMRRRMDRLAQEQTRTLAAYFQEHPEIQALYDFKQQLWDLLRHRGLNPHACRPLAQELLDRIDQLKASAFEAMSTLGQTLDAWKDEIARMWRFSRNNGITEGFHNKMEMISRRAYGFRNFRNYRLRVRAMCG
jgi:transposase